MSWVTKTLTSSLGRKLIMAVTGLSLIAFLLVHCGINACIFLNDGGHTFNEAAEFMANNLFIRVSEVALMAGFIIHIVDGLMLWKSNNEKRPVKYAVVKGEANSTWYSRSMGLLGSLLLIFLVIHLRHFWVVSRFTDVITGGQKTLFQEMVEVFANPFPVALYVLGCLSLAYHLLHGFQSAFQTMGWNHPKYTPFVKGLGAGFSILIPLIFAAMPIAMHFGWIQ
ncbi:succinate dehydrogenase cytochrome b subunit [Arcicella sp. LKC2W]|uniref:succinate dehydrogenase cytochrome b subunit n=1 Tax=Arcicella sp. LKC2W TaxID=2984198 RepID=UPI002B2045D6|nr:succinate dehydrogenase cytochrome b subunit [Arcicella sp. LKC2W]MEA5460289.1 succinate dehydrogenase cytochrome b subunit [Arcicella sp. LKC2W]